MNQQNDKERFGMAKKSEEIADIVERMPMAFGRWVAVVVIIFAALLLLFGWLIKYPDTVTGQIRINSSASSVKLVANTSGNIRLLGYQAKDEIAQDEYIAVIENPANTDDVRLIASIVRRFNPNEILNGSLQLRDSIRRLFPEKVSLGDLNLKYYAFLTSLKDNLDYQNDNVYEKQRTGITDDIKWKENILNESEQLLAVARQKREINQKWLEKYESMNKTEILTYEYEVDRSRSELLTARSDEQNLLKETSSIKMQIVENQNALNRLGVEQKDRERALKMELLSAFHDLTDNIKFWEQKYVFKSPFNGKLEYLKFLTNNQFIQAGEEIFGIVPEETNVFGQVFLPSVGAGKVKHDSRVIVKLDNYPYMEYGSIDGRVSSVSLLTQPQKTEQAQIETYLIVVELPDGLTTNYGETLDFRYEIAGTANIIVKERRLIERLFDNLKYRTK
jgi:multidrug resistance efflux pump